MAKTKGGIILKDIKIGDIHYEYEYGEYIECEVITLPIREVLEDGDAQWTWKSKIINSSNSSFKSNKIIDYLVSEKYYYYGPNLYNNDFKRYYNHGQKY
ncbi:hypothetical protein M0Q50_06625 [bacterium]|nr:hypothetical protein [bacterium]